MRFYKETHYHGALFSMIVKQQRGQVVTATNDAAHRQTATRRDAGPVAAPETKPQGSAAR